MKKVIEKYNDALSVQYDEATGGEFNWRAPNVFESYVKNYLKPGIEALDIGVGTGQTAQILAASGASVTGIDISEKMLEIAKNKVHFKKLIKHDIEDGLSSLFESQTFDVISAIGILEFIKDFKKVLAEMKVILKDAGVIIFTYEIYDPKNKYGIEKDSLLGAGSSDIPELLRFMVYRRIPLEIDKILQELDLKIISREQFTAYLKSQLKIPVPYELIVAPK